MENALSTLELTAFFGAIGYPEMRVSTLVLALTAGALSAACVQDVRFNPSGCDVQVRGRWLVNGQEPTAETCENIALVELAIIDEPVLQFWSPPEFLLKCDAETDANAVVDGGAYLDTQLVTRNRCDGTGAILARPPEVDGEFRYKSRWRATTGLKFVVDCSPVASTELTTIDGGTQMLLDVGTVDFRTMDGGVACPAP